MHYPVSHPVCSIAILCSTHTSLTSCICKVNGSQQGHCSILNPWNFKSGKELIKLHLKVGVIAYVWFLVAPIVGNVLKALPHTSLLVKWYLILSLYAALARLMPFFRLCLAVLDSFRWVCTSLVILGFLFGKTRMRLLVVTF